MALKKRMKIIIISDGTGETATNVSRAVMTQFKDCDVYFTRYKNVRTTAQVDSIFEEAAIHHDLIMYTVVDMGIRDYITNLSREKHVKTLDVLGPAITSFSNYFDEEPNQKPGLLYEVNDDYFKRMDAMEFTLNHDNGGNLKSLHLADIVLIGVSRTSKTPLSIYLSLDGIKVTNLQLSYKKDLPKELFEIDQRKIFALTIDAHTLNTIRKNRLDNNKKIDLEKEYATDEFITKEIDWANQIFSQNKRWPVFDVANKALEETATEIKRLLDMRKNNSDKQSR
jgi:regulator of PEP synthase PpsR (kinase-PPPase family)